MLLLFFRNCCRILWKPLKYHHHLKSDQQQKQQHHHHQYRLPQHHCIMWCFLLFLLSQQNGSQCRPTGEGNHRIQRRFMWKQMDSTVDGFVGRVVTGARVMKSMIGEFMPPKHGNIMDYLPTETTRVRYIIRNPHTKETKVVKIRPTKKVIKIMEMTPKPLLASPEKHNKPPQMPDAEKQRQMEKQKEKMVEGKQPAKHHDKTVFMSLTSEKQKEPSKSAEQQQPSQSDDDIIRGSYSELGDSWKPVYGVGDLPTGFSTAKPITMSSLHTSVIAELLPQPQKQVYEPYEETIDYVEQDLSKPHTYEVTEHTAEESVIQPYTHEYYTYRTLPLTALTLRGSQKQLPITEETNEDSQRPEEIPTPKHYVPDYRPQRGLVPARNSYRTQAETTTAAPSTTTTEEPNYPPGFLKKIRERQENRYHTKHLPRHKPPEVVLENSWLPSNVSYSEQRNKPSYHHSTGIGTRIKSQKWAPEFEESQNSASSYDDPVTTDSPASSSQKFSTHLDPAASSSLLRNNGNSRKNVRLKSNHAAASTAADSDNEHHQHHHHHSHQQQYHKPRNMRQRGSIRFGDKLETDVR